MPGVRQRSAPQTGEPNAKMPSLASSAPPNGLSRTAGQRATEPDHDGPSLIELMHTVWLAKKIIELVCSDGLAQAAQEYAQELNRGSQEIARKGPG